MISVYQIPDEVRRYMDAIEIDEETGEIIVPPEFQNFFADADASILNCLRYVKESQYTVDACKTEERRLVTRRRSIEKKCDWLKGRALEAMKSLNKRKVADSLNTVSIRTSQSVVIEDDAAIPEEFMRIKKEPMKDELKKALKDGSEFAGVHLVTNESVILR